MKKKFLSTFVFCIALSLCTTSLYAYGASNAWVVHDMAKAQMDDVEMLANYFTAYVKKELEVNAVPLANIDAVDPSFTSNMVDDLYITNGVVTIDLAAATPLHSELRGITITLTPNVVNSLIQNWSCSVSSAMDVSILGTAYNLPKVLGWPLSLCTS